MNKRSRERYAKHLKEIAEKFGATVTLRDETPDWECINVDAHFEHVSVSIDVDKVLGPGLMAHWYAADRDLAQLPAFDSINLFHKRKASLYRGSEAEFQIAFGKACKAVQDGSAFATA